VTVGNVDFDAEDSAPATAAAGILLGEDVSAECARHLSWSSAIVGSRNVLTFDDY
jgi:hypothetical protein